MRVPLTATGFEWLFFFDSQKREFIMLFLQDPFSAWWESLVQDYLDELRREEASLQLELAGGEDHPQRIGKRIEEFGAGARAFLGHVHLLLQASRLNPIIHWWAGILLRQFVHNFIQLEHTLARQAHLPNKKWRDLHGKRLVSIVTSDESHFGQILALDRLPDLARQQVVQGFVHKLGIPNARETAPQQMG